MTTLEQVLEVLDRAEREMERAVEETTREAARDAAEIARLRDALKKVTEVRPWSRIPWTHEAAADAYWAALDRCRDIARAALEPKP